MGPLAQLYAYLQHQRPIVLDGPPSGDLPTFDDPPIREYVPNAAQPLPRQYSGPVDWLFNKPPAAPTPSFRDPSMQAGPAPPVSDGKLAAMFGKGRP